MDIMQDLATWGDLTAPGKHSKMEPALFAACYKYRPVIFSRWTPPRMEIPYSMWDRVSRAIPVDGTVGDPPPSWEKSPQVCWWLEEKKPTILQRIAAWLKSPANR